MLEITGIIHPENFFSTKKDLQKDSGIKYVSNLQDLIDVVKDINHYDKIKPLKILWSEKLENMLWKEEPWNNPYVNFRKNTNQYFIQQFHIFFKKNAERIDTSSYESCDSKPPINFHMKEALEETRKLISSCIKRDSAVFVIKKDENNVFSYQNKKLDVRSVNSPSKLYEQIKTYKNWWPQNRNEPSKLEICIAFYEKKTGEKFISTPNFSRTFMTDFLNSNQKDEIIERIGLRLTLNTNDASRNRKLKEHEVYNRRTKRDELRFYVDNFGSRIHCLNRPKEKIIVFTNYFPSSKHDDYKKK